MPTGSFAAGQSISPTLESAPDDARKSPSARLKLTKGTVESSRCNCAAQGRLHRRPSDIPFRLFCLPCCFGRCQSLPFCLLSSIGHFGLFRGIRGTPVNVPNAIRCAGSWIHSLFLFHALLRPVPRTESMAIGKSRLSIRHSLREVRTRCPVHNISYTR